MSESIENDVPEKKVLRVLVPQSAPVNNSKSGSSKHNGKKEESTAGKWLGRDLNKYKENNREQAETKGVLALFMGAETLTKAKKILKGIKG